MGDVPVHLQEGLRRYLDYGIPPGHFLTAVLSHDLFDAINRGDDESIAGLVPLVRWLANKAPARSHGSRAIVAAWCDAGGSAGVPNWRKPMDDADWQIATHHDGVRYGGRRRFFRPPSTAGERRRPASVTYC